MINRMPFQVDFGEVTVGKTRRRRLRAVNPNDYSVHVVVEKFPVGKNFTIDVTQFDVEPGKDYCPANTICCAKSLLGRVPCGGAV